MRSTPELTEVVPVPAVWGDPWDIIVDEGDELRELEVDTSNVSGVIAGTRQIVNSHKLREN